MIDDLFQRRPKRHVKDLNIVPILDMLTTVIFFLLMSTTFIEFTKLTVPPAKTSVITEADSKPPVAPKLLLTRQGTGLKLLLTWGGEKAGEASERVGADALAEVRRDGLIKASRKLADSFARRFPAEKTLQVGLGAQVPYQDLISVMDGVREPFPDIALISYAEAEARSNGGSGAEGEGGGE